MPKISVCIPVHNSASWLAESIDSIAGQTFTDWELVIFDDGSTDSSQRIIDHYRKTLDGKIGWCGFTADSQGIAHARNWCNSHAKGEIIVVQDSDDISHKDRLKKTWKFFQRHKDIDLIYGAFQYIDVFGKPFGQEPVRPWNFEEWKKRNYIAHPTVAYRKKAALEIPYRLECSVLDDLFLYLDFHKGGKKIAHLEDVLSFYRVRPGSVSRSKADEILKMREQFEAETK